MPARPKPKGKPKQQEASEGFVYGPTDKSYSVSDIPKMKEQIANNPALAGMLQPLIDRLEAGDFDKPWGPPDEDVTNTPDTTDATEYSYKGITAQNIIEHLGEVSQLTPEQLGVADVNQDGTISIGDASWILQMAQGLRDPDTLEAIEQPDTPTEEDTTPPGATNQEDIKAAIAAAMQEAGIGPDFNFSDVLTAADAEDLFKNTLPIDYETLQKMGQADWMPENWTPTMQAMIDESIGNIPDQNYIDQATLDEQLAGLPDAAQIQKLLEEQGWGALGDPFGGALSAYSTTDMIQQMIKDNLAQGLSEDDIFAMIQEQFGETMSDEDIYAAIATAQETQYTSLMDEVNALIAEKLAEGMSEQEIIDLITAQYGDQMSPEDINLAITTALDNQYTSLMEEVNARIAEALTDGMTPEQIAEMIRAEYGDQMSDEDINLAITTAQEAQYTSLMDEVNALIAEKLAEGMTEADILALIQTEYGGVLSADDITAMIATAIAGIETTPTEDALTADAVQQMIDAAMAQGMSTEQVQAMLAESGHLNQEQVQAMLGESGYMGDVGVQGLIDTALQGALGQGGSINEAIQNALLAVGDTTIDTGTQQPSSPYGTYTSPYGDVDPYALMHNPWYGTTPFAGGTTTGAEDPTGLGDLDLGNPADYNFDISTEYDEDLFS